ncbi:O-methyltransferase [Sphingosinicella terrae]|uniref:O-methyltransferase n=1 Tax=Sphingosinicella terrae TaxID=2172047 RepID=UPI0013B3AECC|nr:class I SAM-dependent methyltransferase [Sphingosinicella terrae]
MADQAFAKVLARYEERAAQEAELWRSTPPGEMFARRDEMLLHVGAEAAEFLRALAVARGARHLVELGTSYGYSTLFLAEAARRTGGKLTTFELDENKQAYARAQLAEADLADHVDWKLGDAVALLDELAGEIDFVLIDLWKDLYVPCLDKLHPKLATQAIIAADNMLYPEMSRPDAEAYRQAVRDKGDFQSMLLPIGSGIELSCLWRSPTA